MARAMGYVGGWRELNRTLKIPHQPVYLDTSTDADLLSRFATRLSEQLGYPYAHGRVYSAIQNSGAGYSPKTRRQLQDAQTPGEVESSSICCLASNTLRHTVTEASAYRRSD